MGERYNETSYVFDRKRFGRPRGVKKAIKAVRKKIERNLVRKREILSQEIT